MTTFYNPGEIDPRAITTLGVNVKDSDSPVGFFGTGLKYAVAVLLREQQHLVIWSGLRKFSFEARPETIRGKEFKIIFMREGNDPWLPLGFTTEFGKNWSLANAYRELFCNAKDEGGDVLGEDQLVPASGQTLIQVQGADFDIIHQTRHDFLLDQTRPRVDHDLDQTQPRFEHGYSPALQVFHGPSSQIFYRGIAAATAPSCHLLWNLTSFFDLTEDRTLKYMYFVNNSIAAYITKSLQHERALFAILTTDCMEHKLDLSACDCIWSETFEKVLREALKTKPQAVDERVARRFYNKEVCPGADYVPFAPTPNQQSTFDNAHDRLCAAGFDINCYEVKLVESLGENILGLAMRKTGTIYLSRLTFTHSRVMETLLEEFIHLAFGVDDNTRKMQDVLLTQICHLAGSEEAVPF